MLVGAVWIRRNFWLFLIVHTSLAIAREKSEQSPSFCFFDKETKRNISVNWTHIKHKRKRFLIRIRFAISEPHAFEFKSRTNAYTHARKLIDKLRKKFETNQRIYSSKTVSVSILSALDVCERVCVYFGRRIFTRETFTSFIKWDCKVIVQAVVRV